MIILPLPSPIFGVLSLNVVATSGRPPASFALCTFTVLQTSISHGSTAG